MPSRKIEDLLPALQPLARQFAAEMAVAGIPFIFTCTRRTQEEQDVLYEQGRTKPGKIVTWTRQSNHIEGRAFDIAICVGRVPSWDIVKTDVNRNEVPDYMEAGRIGERLGLKWGGRFKARNGKLRPDYPHFELA